MKDQHKVTFVILVIALVFAVIDVQLTEIQRDEARQQGARLSASYEGHLRDEYQRCRVDSFHLKTGNLTQTDKDCINEARHYAKLQVASIASGQHR